MAPLQLLAWGPKGHQVVADVAYSRLTPQTRKNLKLLLGHETLASISTWADDVRKQHDEAYDWHFVDIPKDAEGFDEQRDCFRPQDKHKDAQTDHHNCVVDRIEIFEHVLGDANATREQRTEALKWVVHFVGDLHQPLHAIDEARGGNDIKLPVFGNSQCGDYPCNLHWLWDSILLEHAGLSEHDYARRVQKLIRTEHLDQKAGGGPVDWANESHLQARKILQDRPAAVDQAYYDANIKLINEKLALAGIRLASVLNNTLGKISNQQLKQELKAHKN
ncbi:MAG TPA: S1/P1 nuclease [Verrucomicrobiae bacterium]|nr:S1/P1 nuclease [Verrucomicrobiae bacterium]